ncbi:transposase [Mucilaginibacter sp. BJC16-A38]|uniref:transposase n=1 Tax=Mucilaginibacter phenanthrenivorans TaxID=1234842 RepID=UPI0021573F11|nr:transposase [Mucilaginibacter phenanthrenivorans]MCR8560209.1 transposase [Mucilaginibacter phenanthrenivorans]
MEKQSTKKPKKYNYFIGIDVSKDKLDYAVMKGRDFLFHREEKNEPDAIVAFAAELNSLPGFKMAKAIFCMEDTGFYCNHLVNSLRHLKANVHVGNATHIKNSLGLVKGKSDKVDSIRIAKYCWKNRDELELLDERRLPIRQLTILIALRSRLLGVSLVVKTPLKEQAAFIDPALQTITVDCCVRTVCAVGADLNELDGVIDKLIDADEHLKRLNQIITSVPGVGRITALQLLICTNEFRSISDPRKFASYAGVAPFKKESGKGTGIFRARVVKSANIKMKSLLHICAMRAVRYDEDLKKYYHRKTAEEKKPKMSALNAVRNKLILRVFVCVKHDRLYSKDYISEYPQAGYQTGPITTRDAIETQPF